MQPSISECGSAIISGMSLQVPGSPSSALTTRYCGLAPVPWALRDEAPLHAGREAGAAAAAQAGVLDQLDQLVRVAGERVPQRRCSRRAARRCRCPRTRGLSQRRVSTGVIGSGVAVVAEDASSALLRQVRQGGRRVRHRRAPTQPRSAASCAPRSVSVAAELPATAPARSGKIPASSSSTVRKSVSGAPRVGSGRSPRCSASTSSCGRLDGLVVEELVVDLQHRARSRRRPGTRRAPG